MWQKDVSEYCKACDRCQKENKSTGKRLGNMIKIQQPRRPYEIFHMDWVTGLPPGGDRSYNACLVIFERFKLELEYKTSIHTSTNQTPPVLEKGWNPKLPQDSLRRYLVELHPRAASFKGMLEKARKHAVRDLVIVSTTNFNNIKGCKKLKDSFEEPFVIKALCGENAVEVELSEELSNKHPTSPVSLIKPDKSSDAEKFPLRNKAPHVIPPIESSGIKQINQVLKEQKVRINKVREYLVRYSDPACEDEWLAEKDIPEATNLLKMFRQNRNNNITK
ncbi:hypothetical protein O181_045900 [Austropuccinia psidii MF-1]|uniref:Integrase zinc-binding domain-containing protein n=1 Tax=Austropuccinia psidii MF-1 TaxID=1389203 RepID=A0A9Q3HLM7_9BASI|nr:hypothetical protein [Austropuccinia psidii MF-1]